MTQPKLRLGMVGGGQGAFIGAIHRMAARLDDRFTLVAGAFSSDPARAHASGTALGIDPVRSYDSFETMATTEAARADGIDAVAIVTPNHLHAPAAIAFLTAGIHVICDKPLAHRLDDAERLIEITERHDRLLIVTYNYTGYAMVRYARDLVATGVLGDLRISQTEYAQEWLTLPLEQSGHKQAAWRTDPTQAGLGGCLGDIGTHAFHLTEFVTGQRVEALAADLSAFGAGRILDDNAHILLRFAGGARGMLWASQVAPGQKNGLRLRLYGTRGGLEWHQENPDSLDVSLFGQPTQRLTRGGPTLPGTDVPPPQSRLPAGHPEGYLEGFATLYSDAADALLAHRAGGRSVNPILPTVTDGARGLRFIQTAVTSAQQDTRWLAL